MAFKLGYYAGASPFYGSRLAFWRHHDAVFRKLCKEHDLEIHVILPVQGGQQFVDRLYSGDHGVLYPTLREMNITFHSDPVHIPELEAVYIDDIHSFQDVTVQGVTYTAQEQRETLDRILLDMADRNLPIVFSDTDGFCTEILEGQKAAMMDLYDEWKGWDKLHVITPFINETIVADIGDRFHMVPFEVDPADFQPIKPMSKRAYLLRYVGNFYYREHFLPAFHNLSQIGRVQVNGAGWNPYKAQAPKVNWNVKISMTPDNVNQVYGDSILGLTGRSSYNALKGQEIYLYRWKEYLTAGTLIVPENLPAYTSVLPKGLTQDHILNLPTAQVQHLLDLSDEQYLAMVRSQREVATEFFGVDKWLPLFKEMFGMKG